MKLLVLNNLASGYGEGAIYDFVRSFAADGDEVCLRSTDGTTELESLITDARDFDAVIASGGDGTVTAAIEGKSIIKELYVPKKLVNIVVK